MILKEVLRRVREKGCIEVVEISRELGIPTGLVEHAIRMLKAMGYITLATPSSRGVPCNSCPLKSACGVKGVGLLILHDLGEGKGIVDDS